MTQGRSHIDEHPRATSTFPDHASLFTFAKGDKVVMAADDAEGARAPVPSQSQLVSTRSGATHILSKAHRQEVGCFVITDV